MFEKRKDGTYFKGEEKSIYEYVCVE